MTHFFKRAAIGALLAAFAFAAPAFAHDVTVGSLTLSNLWARATPPKAPTGAGYLDHHQHRQRGGHADRRRRRRPPRPASCTSWRSRTAS